MNEKRTDLYILRIAACLMVVVTHVSAEPMIALQGDNLPHIFYKVLNASTKFCVPLFLFLSAFLLTKKQKAKVNYGEYYLKILKRLAMPYVFWLLAYYFVFVASGVYVFSIEQIAVGIFTGSIVFHLYYMLISIQLYVFFPLLLKARVLAGYIPLVAASAVFYVYAGALPALSGYTHLLLGTYLVYVFLGMFLAEYEEKIRLESKARGFWGVVLFAASSAVFYFSYTPYFTTLKSGYMAGSVLGILAMYLLSGFLAEFLKGAQPVLWVRSISASTEIVYYAHVALMLAAAKVIQPQRYALLFLAQLGAVLALWVICSVFLKILESKSVADD